MALTKVTGQVIKNTTDVTVGVLTVTNTLAVGGTVSIGGTLTYEDVTNVDAVGIITARSNILVGSGITLSPDGDVFATGISTFSEGFAGDILIDDKIVHRGDTNTAIRFPASDRVTVETDGTEAIRVDPSQNFGVGTASPTARLDVRRGDTDGKIAEFHQSAGYGIDIGSSQALAYISSGYNQNWAFKTDSGSGQTERVRISSSGNFGIGSNNPQVLLHIASATPTLRIHDTTNNFYSHISVDDSGSLTLDGDAGNGAGSSRIVFKTDGSEHARITNDGRLGVGIAAPTKLLDIATATSADGIRIRSTGNTYNEIAFDANRTSANTHIGRIISHWNGTAVSYISMDAGSDTTNKDDGMIRFWTANGSGNYERLRIHADGEVEVKEAAAGQTVLSAVGNYSSSSNVDIATFARSGGAVASAIRYADASTSMLFGTTTSHKFGLMTGGTERVHITSAGDVIIGTSSYAYNKPLNVQGSTGAILSLSNYDTTTYAADTHTGIELRVNTGNTGNQNGSCEIRAFKENGTNGNNARALSFYTGGNGGSPAERYRIHSDGKQSWNNTTFPYGETFHFYNGNEGSCASFYQNSSNDHTNLILRHGRGLSGYNGYQMLFKRNDGTNVGSIISGASSTSFNTSSDYRLKENQITIPNAIDKLNKLKPYEFNFKDDPDYKHLGFFAHEVQEIIPNGVAYGEKDEVYTEDSPSESDDYKKGDMKIQSLDYGKLTPLLTAALQEAIVEIESLKAEVAALKSN